MLGQLTVPQLLRRIKLDKTMPQDLKDDQLLRGLMTMASRTFFNMPPSAALEVQDLQQIGLIEAVESYYEYDPQSGKQLNNWIFMCAKTKMLQAVYRSCEKESRRVLSLDRTFGDDTALTLGSQITDNDTLTASAMEQAEALANVWDFLQTLTLRQREVFQYKWSGYTDEEVAGFIQSNPRMVGREIKKIRQAYLEFGEVEYNGSET